MPEPEADYEIDWTPGEEPPKKPAPSTPDRDLAVVQARAAKVLGISERSLWYRIKKLGIQVRTPEDGPPAG